MIELMIVGALLLVIRSAYTRISALEDEVEILERYRVACFEAQRWLTPTVNGSEVATWIQAAGEGERAPRLEVFRETLVKVGP